MSSKRTAFIAALIAAILVPILSLTGASAASGSVTITSNDGGTINVLSQVTMEGNVIYVSDDNPIVFEVIPNEGHEVYDVKLNNSSLGISGPGTQTVSVAPKGSDVRVHITFVKGKASDVPVTSTAPSPTPTIDVSVSTVPSESPSTAPPPSAAPSNTPTTPTPTPTATPSQAPVTPTPTPTREPSSEPSDEPSDEPVEDITTEPSSEPSEEPTAEPTEDNPQTPPPTFTSLSPDIKDGGVGGIGGNPNDSEHNNSAIKIIATLVIGAVTAGAGITYIIKKRG